MNKPSLLLRNNIPLWIQVGLSLLVALLIINLLTVSLLSQYLRTFLIKQVDVQSNSSFALMSATAVDAVISEDIPLLETVINQALVQTPSMVAILVENELGDKLVQRSRNIDPSSYQIRDYNYPIELEGETFGIIKIQWNIESVHQQINHYVTIVQYFVSMILVVLSGISFLFIHSVAIQPIHRITDFLSNLSANQHPLPLKLTHYYSQELVLLATSANKLANSIKLLGKQTNDLEQAKNEAIQANEAKSKFLSNMSHELRTPLNSVIGYTELIKLEQEKSFEQKHNVSIEQINFAGRHLLSLVDDILDFSKIEAGKLEIENNEFETAQLLQEVVTLFTHDIKAKDLKIEALCADNVPVFVKGDVTRIKQILINLMSNAIKFTPEGLVLLELSSTEVGNEQVLLHFNVTDTGIGVSAEQQAIIFDSFSQADISTTRTHGGTGLGLSIVKHLVELMNGEIGIESELGQGATFWFKVSLEKIDQLQPTDENENLDESQFLARILVVEDFQANQMLIARFLEFYGCTVDVVNNGQLAIKAYQSHEYDLIFMDCQMPVLDGYESTRIIRGYQTDNGNKRHIPIIALTAHALDINYNKCLVAGMDGVITKPFSRKDLYDALKQWLPLNCVINNNNYSTDVDFKNEQKIGNLRKVIAIDITFLEQNFDLCNDADLKFISKLTTVFQQNGKDTLQLLRQAIDRTDSEETQGYAHDLKSICANVGAIKLTELCKSMEQLGQTKDMSFAVTVLKQMEEEFSLVIADLYYINRLNNSV